MKNNSKFNRGSVNSIVIAIIAVIVIVAVAYFFYEKGKSAQVIQENNLSVVVSTTTDANTIQTSNTVANPNTTPTVSLSGSSFKNGDRVVITWSGPVVPSGELPSVVLFPSQQPYSGTPIVSAISANTYTWTIPSTIQPGTYYIQVYDENNANTGAKSKVFTITNQNAVTSNSAESPITVTSPNGGETIKIGQTYPISWTFSNLSTSTLSVFLHDYSINCPAGYTGCWTSFGIASGLTNTGNYSWNTNEKMFGDGGPNSVTVTPGSEYKIKICEDSTNVCDESNNYFTITN